MPLVLAGATSGQATVQATDAATVTLTLPATSGTVALTSGGGSPTFTTVTATTVATSNLTIGGTALGAGDSSMLKNRIINGAMVIDQRNAGASVTPASSAYTLDRWQAVMNVASKFSVQQSSTTATGFSKSLLATSTSAYSIGASEYCLLQQLIEGFNIADLGWGTANAKTVTLSFQVRSSLTGTFGGVIANSNFSRCYPFTYTISSANTYESKTVTIAGDTSGTWDTTNGAGILVNFSLGSGSTVSGTAGAWAGSLLTSATGATSVVGTNGATFYITGVQLEVGTQATSFEYRQYQQELALCQRYYYIARASQTSTNFAIGRSYSSTEGTACYTLPVPMRTTPTGSTPTVSGNFTYSLTVLLPAANYTSNNHVMTMNCTGAFTANGAFAVEAANTNAFIAWSAEL